MLIQRRPVPAHALPDHLPTLIRRLYAARGLTDVSALGTTLRDLPPPSGMRGLDAAAAVIGQAIVDGRRIVVAGDYDADGATATAVALIGLRTLGAVDPGYVVPNRFTMGYGLSPALVDIAQAAGAGLLITVDNGVSSFAGARHAQALGLPLVITDHHLPGAELPPCSALVNPNQPGCGFGSRCLSGVGVMFYVLTAVRAWLATAGRFAGEAPALAPLLDLVAIGTIADLVPLDRANRALVAQGLARIRAGRARPGVLALLRGAGRDPARVFAGDIAFTLAPRINAAGRLDDMRTGIDCLLADEPDEAEALAARLEAINRERRSLTTSMTESAESLVAGLGDKTGAGICVFDPGWHEGIVGLVAARLKERFHRPSVAFSPAQTPGELKGSARSIPGLHLRDLLADLDTAHPGLLLRFGGHAMAAGVSIQASALAQFEAAFVAGCATRLNAEQLEQRIETDGSLSAAELVLDSAHQIEQAGPWGQGFPEPCFDDEFTVSETRAIGADASHVRYKLRTRAGQQFAAVDFGGARRLCETGRVRAVYRPVVNLWNGRESLDLHLRWIEPA